MSELKWNWAYYPYLDPPEKQAESALKAGYIKVVNKSEVDKVISEKDEEIEKLKRQIEFLKVTHSSCKECNKCAEVMGKVFDKRLKELKAENERLRGESCKLTDGCLRLKQCRKEKANIADELRHSNHKRCLVMAKWCAACRFAWSFMPDDDEVKDKCKFYEKWKRRWEALAKEPTWAKFLQLIHKEAK